MYLLRVESPVMRLKINYSIVYS